LQPQALDSRGDTIPVEMASQTPLSIVRNAKEFLQASVNTRPTSRINRRASASATPTGPPFEEAERDLLRQLPPCMMRGRLLRQAESAPPTRGYNATLSPIRAQSPPRTDPPRRRRRKSKALGTAVMVPDSPIPSPNGARRKRRAGYPREAAEMSLVESARADIEQALPTAFDVTAVGGHLESRSGRSSLMADWDCLTPVRDRSIPNSARSILTCDGDAAAGPSALAPAAGHQISAMTQTAGVGDGLDASDSLPVQAFDGLCSLRDELNLDESLTLQAPLGMENLFRRDCDYGDDGEDHMSPSPRFAGRWGSGQ